MAEQKPTPTPMQVLSRDLNSQGALAQFKAALPSHVTPEKLVRVVLTAVQANEELLFADRQSLLSSAMKAAQDGLLPDGREGAFVTFRTKTGKVLVQWMPMIAGLLKKVRNSGELATMTTRVIYENDVFTYKIDTDDAAIERMVHEPKMFSDRGKILGAYAVATTKDGFKYIEVMSEDEISDVRKVSRASNGPWSGPFANEMRRKTVFRRLAKRLPQSTDLADTLDREADLFMPDPEAKSVNALPPQRSLEQIMHEEATPVAPVGKPEEKPVTPDPTPKAGSSTSPPSSISQPSPTPESEPIADGGEPEDPKPPVKNPEPQPEENPFESPPAAPQEPKSGYESKDHSQMGAIIVKLMSDLKWDKEAFNGFASTVFNKTPRQMSVEEMRKAATEMDAMILQKSGSADGK